LPAKCSKLCSLGAWGGGRHAAEKPAVALGGLEWGLGIRDFDDELKIIEKNLMFFSLSC
jgi:hypothetical protein